MRAAVQRVPRRRHPARIGVGGEERRLLGVGAEAGDDQQRDAVGRRCRRHAVEGGGDVGPHRLALAVGQRTRVAAAAGHRRAAASGGELGGASAASASTADGLALALAADLDLGTAATSTLDRREGRASGKLSSRRPGRPVRLGGLAAPRPARGPGRRRLSRWAGFGDPLGRSAGASSRGKSSRIERAAESAARSAARCTRPFPVTAPAIATSASASAITATSRPAIAGTTWPGSVTETMHRVPGSASRNASRVHSRQRSPAGDSPGGRRQTLWRNPPSRNSTETADNSASSSDSRPSLDQGGAALVQRPTAVERDSERGR